MNLRAQLNTVKTEYVWLNISGPYIEVVDPESE